MNLLLHELCLDLAPRDHRLAHMATQQLASSRDLFPTEVNRLKALALHDLVTNDVKLIDGLLRFLIRV